MEHIQLLALGGIIFDVAPPIWELIRDELTTRAEVEFEDIYGSHCWMRTSAYIGARHWTPESGARYQEINNDDEPNPA